MTPSDQKSGQDELGKEPHVAGSSSPPLLINIETDLLSQQPHHFILQTIKSDNHEVLPQHCHAAPRHLRRRRRLIQEIDIRQRPESPGRQTSRPRRQPSQILRRNPRCRPSGSRICSLGPKSPYCVRLVFTIQAGAPG